MDIETRRDTDWNILRRYAAAAYLAGVATNAFILAFVPAMRSDAIVPLALAELAVGVMLLLWRDMPGWAVRLFGISGAIVMISVGVAVARPLGPTPVWYVLPGMAIARFCGTRETLANLALLIVGYGIGLHFAHDAQVPAVTFGAIVTVVVLLTAAHRRQVQFTGTVMAQLESAAAVDPLTGLLNRGALNAAFTREVERARTSALPLSIVLFDLDHFKAINDTHGHDVGDAALRRFADVLTARRRATDLVSRMGGEEFVAVLFDTDRSAAERFAEDVADALAASPEVPAFTTSAGIASLSDELNNPFLLLRAADRALYSAKAQGRNRIVAHDEPPLVERSQRAG